MLYTENLSTMENFSCQTVPLASQIHSIVIRLEKLNCNRKLITKHSVTYTNCSYQSKTVCLQNSAT